MRTQRSSTNTNPANLAEALKSLVTVWFQAAKVVLCDGGYIVIPDADVFNEIEVPAYRMAGHLEDYVAQEYPGLTLVDWEVR